VILGLILVVDPLTISLSAVFWTLVRVLSW
jgi:hypothetical protein